MKTIGVTGGTGFIGTHLIKLLTGKGYNVVIFTRELKQKQAGSNISYALLDAEKESCDSGALGKVDDMVHLAGAGVADKRWTDARKKEIVDSRVKATDFLIEQLKMHAPNCKTFIAASATGFYGPDRQSSHPFTENDPPYKDFLGEVCAAWENASYAAEKFMRTVIFRFGIVLGKERGAFPQFEQPMKFGVMPILGNGRQIVSWIEVDDLAKMIMYAIERQGIKGIFNAVSPHPVPHKELMHTIEAVKGGIKIPVPVPEFALKIMLGELSTEVLKSCTVSAQKIIDTGFIFSYPEIKGAVRKILATNS